MQSGIYVEIKELLGDNISLLNELKSLNVVTTLPAEGLIQHQALTGILT